MRLLATESLSPEVILGKTIYNDRGSILVSKGTKLTDKIIQRLIDLQIQYVYIEDERTAGIVPESSISNELRISAIQTIESSFSQLQINDKS